jgi:hypothetical protein
MARASVSVMTDAHILDAILRRIGDQATDDRSRVDSAPRSDGGHGLTRNGKTVGTMHVEGGTVVVTIVGSTPFSVPAIADSPLTEADINATAAVILRAASAL